MKGEYLIRKFPVIACKETVSPFAQPLSGYPAKAGQVRKRLRKRLIVCAFLSLLFIAGCLPRMVVYEGKRMPSDKAVDSIKQKAEKQLSLNDYKGAMELYASIAAVDRKSTAAAYGLLKAGDIALGVKAYPEAAYYYNKLVHEYPESSYAVDAMICLGTMDLKQSRYSDAIDRFKALVPVTGSNKKGRVYFLLGEAYYRAGMYKDAFDAVSRSTDLLLTAPEQELAQLLLGKLADTFLTDRDIVELLHNQYPVYETALLRLKLAQDMFASNDYKEALVLIEAVIASGIPSPDIMNKAVSMKNEILAITRVDTTHIGCILPLSGDFGAYGKQVLNGIELALGVFSDTSSPYRLFIMDSKGVPELAVKQAEELVRDNHVAAIIGPLLGSTAQEVAYKMQSYGVPMVVLSQKSNITDVGDYIFQNSLTPEDQARDIVNYAMGTLAIKNFAVLYPESPYGEDMMQAFVKHVLEHGGIINGLEGYFPTETDFQVQIKKLAGTYYLDLRKQDIKQLPPDQKNNPPPVIDFSAVFIPDYYEKVAMIAPQLLYYDINNVQLLGGNGWSGEGLIQMGGRYVDGAIYTDGFFTQSTNKRTVLFVNTYRAAFSQEPTILSALGYDTANLIIAAMNNAASRQDIKNNLLKIKDYNGVTGITTYNGSRVPVKKLYLLKVNGRKIVEISY